MKEDRARWILALLVAGLVLEGSMVAAAPGFKKYKILESGSFFSQQKQSGVYGDATFDLAMTSGKGGGLGDTSTQARFVWDYTSIVANPDTDNPPYLYQMNLAADVIPTSSGFVLRAHHGDLLFGKADPSSTNKFNDATGEFRLDINGVITGGTGRFEEATGTFVIVATGATLPGAGGYFGWVVSEGEIKIDK